MYHLFAGHNYYPEPGLGDYVGPFESEDLAVERGIDLVNRDDYSEDWWLIITEQHGKLVHVAGGHKERK